MATEKVSSNFKKLKILDLAFISIAFLAFTGTRPNLLGETLGIINPIFWFALVFVGNLISNTDRGSWKEKELLEINKSKKFLNTCLICWGILATYWILTWKLSATLGYSYTIWLPVANLGTVGLLLTAIVSLQKINQLQRLRTSWVLVIFLSCLLGALTKLVFNKVPCASMTTKRGWDYDVCVPGGIFSQGRLTGISGEPAIFATFCCIAVSILICDKRIFSRRLRYFVFAIIAWGILLTGSSTGYVEFVLVVAVSFMFRSGPRQLGILLSGVGVLYFYLLEVISSLMSQVIEAKSISNEASITDRGLHLSFSDYFDIWTRFPFGTENGFSLYGFGGGGINLLSETVVHGFWVIPMFLTLMLFILVRASHIAKSIPTLLVVISTCFFSQPVWANASWVVIPIILVSSWNE